MLALSPSKGLRAFELQGRELANKKGLPIREPFVIFGNAPNSIAPAATLFSNLSPHPLRLCVEYTPARASIFWYSHNSNNSIS